MEVALPFRRRRNASCREGGVFRGFGQHQEYLRLTENILRLCEELAQENISARTFDKLVYPKPPPHVISRCLNE